MKVAVEIAEQLGETGERPRAQIARIVGLMGEAWTRDVAHESAQWTDREVGPAYRKDGTPRTEGGAFFALAREYGRAALTNGTIEKRDFYRCFYDYPPKPRTKTAAPLKPVRPNGKKARRDVTHNWGAPRTRDQRAPEVYNVVRRSVGQRAGRA
jgi:hypothetical protein